MNALLRMAVLHLPAYHRLGADEDAFTSRWGGEVLHPVVLPHVRYLDRERVEQHLDLFGRQPPGRQHDLAAARHGRFCRNDDLEAYLSMMRDERTTSDLIELTAHLVPFQHIDHAERLREQHVVLLVEVGIEERQQLDDRADQSIGLVPAFFEIAHQHGDLLFLAAEDIMFGPHPGRRSGDSMPLQIREQHVLLPLEVLLRLVEEGLKVQHPFPVGRIALTRCQSSGGFPRLLHGCQYLDMLLH